MSAPDRIGKACASLFCSRSSSTFDLPCLASLRPFSLTVRYPLHFSKTLTRVSATVILLALAGRITWPHPRQNHVIFVLPLGTQRLSGLAFSNSFMFSSAFAVALLLSASHGSQVLARPGRTAVGSTRSGWESPATGFKLQQRRAADTHIRAPRHPRQAK